MKGVGEGVFEPGGKLDFGVAGPKLVSQSTEFTSPSTQILGGSQFATQFKKFPVQEGCTVKFPSGSGLGLTDPASTIPSVCLAPPVFGWTSYPSTAEVKDVPAADLISPEEAALNVLKVFFDGTKVTSSFGGPDVGTAPLNYLQIYGPDIEYANENVVGWVLDETGAVVPGVTAQSLLNLASTELLKIAE
jgi:hypothetical protein